MTQLEGPGWRLERDISKREFTVLIGAKDCAVELLETELVINTASDMTLQAVVDILRQKATKRNLSLKICLNIALQKTHF